jgi:hypothetical protein
MGRKEESNNMASYFVACDPEGDGAHAVHERSRCPPACFPLGAPPEYLGEFMDAGQAVAVARLRYRPVRRCVHSEAGLPLRVPAVPVPALALTVTPLRP